MDGARVTFAFFGIVYHMAWFHIAYAKDLISIKIFDYSKIFFWITQIIPLFRMHSFFLIAGFFAAKSLMKINFQEFLSKRVVSLHLLNIVPIVFIITSIMSYLLAFSQGEIHQLSSSYWDSLKFMYHLWFLLILFILYGAYGFLIKSNSVITFLQKKILPIYILSLGFIYLAWAFLAKLFPIFWSLNSFIIIIYSIFTYLPYFLLGAVIYHNKKIADSFMKLYLIRILISLIPIFIYMYLISKQYGVHDGNVEPIFLVKLTLYLAKGFATFCSVYLVFLTSFHIFKNDNRLLKYLTNRSYTVYLLHLPLCWVIGYFFTKVNLDVGFKYVVSVFSVYIITLLMHDVLIRFVKPKTIQLKAPLGANTVNS